MKQLPKAQCFVVGKSRLPTTSCATVQMRDLSGRVPSRTFSLASFDARKTIRAPMTTPTPTARSKSRYRVPRRLRAACTIAFFAYVMLAPSANPQGTGTQGTQNQSAPATSQQLSVSDLLELQKQITAVDRRLSDMETAQAKRDPRVEMRMWGIVGLVGFAFIVCWTWVRLDEAKKPEASTAVELLKALLQIDKSALKETAGKLDKEVEALSKEIAAATAGISSVAKGIQETASLATLSDLQQRVKALEAKVNP